MENEHSLSVIDCAPVSAKSLQIQVNAIQEAMKQVMEDGVHFGKIPGCGDKPTLLKPGAEKIGMMFRLLPSFTIDRRDYDGGHREYTITCSLTDPTGRLVGQGVGSCSTMESKYRYRRGEPENTGAIVPKSYWDTRKDNPVAAQELIGGRGFVTKKIDGVWMIMRSSDQKTENPDIADQYNTVLKIAKKRSHVDAVLTCTAASDIFTQDIEDMALDASVVVKAEAKSEPRYLTPDEAFGGYDDPEWEAVPNFDEAGKEAPKAKETSTTSRPYSYHLPYEKKGVDMEAIRVEIKKRGAVFSKEDKMWHSPVEIKELDMYLRDVDASQLSQSLG